MFYGNLDTLVMGYILCCFYFTDPPEWCINYILPVMDGLDWISGLEFLTGLLISIPAEIILWKMISRFVCIKSNLYEIFIFRPMAHTFSNLLIMIILLICCLFIPFIVFFYFHVVFHRHSQLAFNCSRWAELR